MKTFAITEDQLKTVLQALAPLPWAQVHQAMQVLTSLPLTNMIKEDAIQKPDVN